MPLPNARNADVTLLHPAFRTAVVDVQNKLNAEGIPFKVFEAFRYPERQADLFAQGRTRPGAIVTKAGPWLSYHQYGLGVDFVLYENGSWSWDTAGAKGKWWARMQELGRQKGLEALSFELPHLQLAGLKIERLLAGDYPPGGDDTWAENLDAAIRGWRGGGTVPPSPPVPQRPALAG